MSEQRIEMRIYRNTEYAAYIEWVDRSGSFVVNDAAASVWMDVRDRAGSLVLRFDNNADTLTSASASVLGTSGIIRLTAPRSVTGALELGDYVSDLVVQFTDPDDVVFTNGQRKRIIECNVLVLDTHTNP